MEQIERCYCFYCNEHFAPKELLNDSPELKEFGCHYKNKILHSQEEFKTKDDEKIIIVKNKYA
jgi:hypothetical protein